MRRSLVLITLLSLAVTLISVCRSVAAEPWPVVTSIETTNCKPGNAGPCSEYYFQGTAALLDLGGFQVPRTSTYPKAHFYGLHCDHGNKVSGYRGCGWQAGTHGPVLQCAFVDKDANDWALEPGCTPPASFSWGPHKGADVGAECAVFGTRQTVMEKAIQTPWGLLDADTVANSGSSQCVKAQDPTLPCDIGIIDELAHGEQGVTGTHTVTVSAHVDCGVKPDIELVGGPEVVLGDGVRTTISAVMTSPNVLRVESRLSTTLATPGSYSSSKILVVSAN